MRLKIVLLVILSLIIFTPSWAAISFTDNFWSTSFVGCNTGDATSSYTCNGLTVEGDYYCDSTQQSQVNSDGNYSGGAGGNGFRTYYRGGVRNEMSNMMRMDFASPVPEFWLRFYYRVIAGQTNSGLPEHKIIFPQLDVSISSPVDWPAQSDISMTMQGTMDNEDIYFNNGGGWDDIYGGSASTTPADGTWHYFEFHFKLGTSGGNNGVFQMWIDGANVANRSDLDWFNGGAASPTGWEHIYFPHNHNTFVLSGCQPHDIDDIAVALPAYSGFVQDSGDRDMIGALAVATTSTFSGSMTSGSIR